VSIACCYCGGIATGRYCFLNQEEHVVDNPFCSKHSTDVYQQTRRSMDSLHRHLRVGAKYALIQRWGKNEDPRPLPSNRQELLSYGAIYLH
jgi:hypothetical protein